MSISRKNSKRRSRKLKKFAKRFAAYSAAAAATAMTTQNRTANAGEVVHDIAPDILVVNQGILFNMVTGAYEVATYNAYRSGVGSMRMDRRENLPIIYGPANSTNVAFAGDFRYFSYTSNSFTYFSTYPYASALGNNVGVRSGGGGQNFVFFNETCCGNYAYLDPAEFPIGEAKFIGFRFALGDGIHFGWAEVTRVSGGQVSLAGFGYDDVVGATSTTPSANNSTADVFGDFNGDDKVDGLDFLLWQRDPSVGSLAHWEANYGFVAPPLSAASSSVPEPSSILLLAAGAAGLGMWRKKRAG